MGISCMWASVFISMYPQLQLPLWLDLCRGSNFPRVLCYSLWSLLILMCKNSHGSGLMIFAHLACHNNRLCLLCATNRRTRMGGEKKSEKRILQGEAFCKRLHPFTPLCKYRRRRERWLDEKMREREIDRRGSGPRESDSTTNGVQRIERIGLWSGGGENKQRKRGIWILKDRCRTLWERIDASQLRIDKESRKMVERDEWEWENCLYFYRTSLRSISQLVVQGTHWLFDLENM